MFAPQLQNGHIKMMRNVVSESPALVAQVPNAPSPH